MKIKHLNDVIDGQWIAGINQGNEEVEYAFASDLMSDVLTLEVDHLLLITGLVNPQVVRTAEMSDIKCIVIVRNKKVTPEVVELAEESHVALIRSEKTMFRVSGELYSAGMKPVF